MQKYLKNSLFKAVVQSVKGINPQWVSSEVKFPKIDLHSWIENTPLDKEQGVREISFVVEGYSNASYEQATTMANEVAEYLCNNYPVIEGATVVSILPDGSEEIEEEDNNNVVIYRQLNRLTVTIKKS